MTRRALAESLARDYAALPDVEAVVFGGSSATSSSDPASDIDLYVYVLAPLPTATRRSIAGKAASRVEVGNAFWEPGDEWIDANAGIAVDVMFRETRSTERHLRELLEHHAASIGYTTALWHNVKHSIVLFDRDGWFAGLQHFAERDYPPRLRDAIVARNLPLLRSNISSYTGQLEKACARGDLVSINHRTAAFLASWFDVLFAINLQTHPGEKRLLDHAERSCVVRPPQMRAMVEAFLRGAASGITEIPSMASALAESIEALVQATS